MDLNEEQKAKLRTYSDDVQKMIMHSPSWLIKYTDAKVQSIDGLRNSVGNFLNFIKEYNLPYSERFKNENTIIIDVSLREVSFELKCVIFGGGLSNELSFK